MYTCQKWLEQAKVDIILTQTTIEVELLDILMLINSNILMPRLVVFDSAYLLHCDIHILPEPCLHSIEVHCLSSSI